jgi:hypothetical protein
VADRDRPKQFRAGADRDVVFDGRVALARGEAGAAERDALVERDVVADLRGLADYDAGTVIDEQALADLGAGMDLDPGRGAAEHRDRARHQRHATDLQRVRDAMREQRLDPRPRGEDLRRRYTARGRIAVTCRGDVAP